MPASTTLYTAILKFNANDGSNPPSDVSMAVAEPNQNCELVIPKAKPTRSNYIFKGWASSKNASVAEYSNPATSSTEATCIVKSGTNDNPANTKTLYAVWKLSSTQYEAILKYMPNGGSNAPASVSYASSSQNESHTFTISKYTNKPTRDHYTFKGWADSSSATTPKYNNLNNSVNITVKTGDSDNPTRTKKIYAVWEADTYTISYNKGSYGTGSNTTQTKYHGTPITLKGEIFTRTGYTQTGWSKADGGDKKYDLGATYSTNASVSLYPYWTKHTYTIRYKKGANGVGEDQTQGKEYGVDVTLKGAIFTSPNPDYEQTGWSTEDGGAKDYNTGGTYSKNYSVTLYPYWSRKSGSVHNVSYFGPNGNRVLFQHNRDPLWNQAVYGEDPITIGKNWKTWDGQTLLDGSITTALNVSGQTLVGWSLEQGGEKLYSLDRWQPEWWRSGSLLLYPVYVSSSSINVKTDSGMKRGIVYVKTESGMKQGIVYVKGNDGNMHQTI